MTDTAEATPKRGRPSLYTPEIAETICARLAAGETMVAICRGDDMPHRVTVLRWLDAHEDFRSSYARAKEFQAEALFEEMLSIADTQVVGEKTTTKGDGSIETVEADMIEHRRLQVDTRKWIVARLAPKKYGDRLTHAGDPEAPMQISVIELVAPQEKP